MPPFTVLSSQHPQKAHKRVSTTTQRVWKYLCDWLHTSSQRVAFSFFPQVTNFIVFTSIHVRLMKISSPRKHTHTPARGKWYIFNGVRASHVAASRSIFTLHTHALYIIRSAIFVSIFVLHLKKASQIKHRSF